MLKGGIARGKRYPSQAHQPTHSTSPWRFSLRQSKFQVQSRVLWTLAALGLAALQGQEMSLGVRSLAPRSFWGVHLRLWLAFGVWL